MRKNRTLTAAITTALSLSSWSAYAQFQFENVGTTATRATSAIQGNGEQGLTTGSSIVAIPNAGFDFTGGETVINVPVDGVPFAAELFGGTGLTLPTVLSAGATGNYMAVVYTIDGQITQNFNMTFTLDNGATFAENPILGVKDKKGSGGGTVLAAIASGATSVVVDQSTMSLNDIFRFTDHATIYKVSAAPITAAGSTSVSFIQLGTASGGATAGSVIAGSRVYKGSQLGSNPTLAVSQTSLTTVRATAAPTSGQKSLAVSNGAVFTSGWSYICNSPSDTGQSIFQVGSVTDSTTTSGMLTVSTVSTGSGVQLYKNSANTTGGLLSSDCATGLSISRIHLPGDTVISLNATGAAIAANKVIQFGVITTPVAFTNTTQYRVGTVDTIKNTITISPALSTILLGNEPLYDANITTGDTWVTGVTQAGVPKTATAAGTNKAIFTLNAGTTTPNLNLATNDQVMLLYKLSNVGALAAAGQKVNMQVDLRTGGVVDVLVNPQRTVTVAASVKGTEVTLSSIEAGKLYISVSSGSTQFSGEMGTGVGFVSNTVAQIGSLKVLDNKNGAVMEDGASPFKIKGTGTTVLADNSKLKITGGQFQASRNSPGKVFINATSKTLSQSNISADFVTQDSAGDWSALWNLDSTEMRSIADASPEAYISIQTDGTTEVNTVENAPRGAFTIDFNNAAYKDITAEGDLRKISKDGTVCTVYQIPPPAPGQHGADLMSIRITNDSSIAAKVTGTLYDMDGTLLGQPNTPLDAKELPAGATLRIESDKIGEVFGGVKWTGRAVLKITSIMPQMEVMALIRQRGVPFAPLSNLSVGAKGTSCQ